MARYFKKRLDPQYKEFRKKVLLRDKHECQMPNNCKAKKKLQVHHIKKYAHAYSLRTDTRNGITLCKDCHASIKGKEEFYAPIFIDIVFKNENHSRH